MQAHVVTAFKTGAEHDRFKALEIMWQGEIYFVLPSCGSALPVVLGPKDGIEVHERHQELAAPSEFRKSAADVILMVQDWERESRRFFTSDILEIFRTLRVVTPPPAATATLGGEMHGWLVPKHLVTPHPLEHEGCGTQGRL